MPSHPSSIPVSDRIPFLQKLAFSAGVNTDYIAVHLMVGTLWMPFFNIGLGMSPLVLGLILMLLRAWEAFADPVIGNISDNARTRWGRRRPFMLVAAVVAACLYPLIWHIPEKFEGTARVISLVLIGLVFYTSYAFWAMPYYGMQLELTPNYDERTRLTAWMTFFGKLSSLIAGWFLSFVLLLGTVASNAPGAIEQFPPIASGILRSLQPLLTSIAQPQPSEKPVVVGMRIACWIVAAGIVFFGLLPALFVRERYYQAEASRQPRDPFWQSLRESLHCKPLWILISISFFLVLGTSSIATLGQYVNFYYVCNGDIAKGAMIAGLKASVFVVVGISSIPLFTWLGEKFDKRRMVFGLLCGSLVGHLLNIFLMTPAHPYLQIIPGVFESCAISAMWLFLPSMKADVADWDELRTFRRREGAINAFYSWFVKIASTLSMGISGLVLQFTGFHATLSVQPTEVSHRMFIIYLLLPIAIWSIALFCAWFYPLTRGRSAQIRIDLEGRRGSL